MPIINPTTPSEIPIIRSFQLNCSIPKNDQVLCTAWPAMYKKIMQVIRGIRAGYFLTCNKVPIGFALFNENSRRFQTGNDSGKTKYPYNQLRKQSMEATTKGTLGPN